MTRYPRTIGFILAGGRSRRMQEQDKALLTILGDTLLAHVIRRLQPQVDCLALNSNAAPDGFAAYGLPVIPDRLPGFLGPLAGIHAGLEKYPEDQLVAVAVDLPFLPPDLVARLRDGLGTKSCAYASDGERHALALLWRPGMAASVEDFLQHGGRRLRDFLSVHGQPVLFNRPQDRGLFCNLNTPEDFVRAGQDAELNELTATKHKSS